MQLQTQLAQSRYEKASSMIRNNAKMFETASTGFATSKNSSFRMRRTSSFTNSNVKSKLDLFDGVLQNLAEQLSLLRKDTTESRKYCQELTLQLTQHLGNKNTSLKKQIKDMSASMGATKKKQQTRLQNIRGRCGQLYDKNMDIRNSFEGLRARLEGMERVMGFYGANEKYKS